MAALHGTRINLAIAIPAQRSGAARQLGGVRSRTAAHRVVDDAGENCPYLFEACHLARAAFVSLSLAVSRNGWRGVDVRGTCCGARLRNVVLSLAKQTNRFSRLLRIRNSRADVCRANSHG